MKAKVHFWHANTSSEYLGRVGHRVEVKVPGAKNACLCITLIADGAFDWKAVLLWGHVQYLRITLLHLLWSVVKIELH